MLMVLPFLGGGIRLPICAAYWGPRFALRLLELCFVFMIARNDTLVYNIRKYTMKIAPDGA